MTPCSFSVLECLKAHMHEEIGAPIPTWSAYPNITTICKWVGRSRAVVKRSLKLLRDEIGVITYDGHGREPKDFYIVLPVEKLHRLPPNVLSSLRRSKTKSCDLVARNRATSGGADIKSINNSPPTGTEKTLGGGVELLRTKGMWISKATELLTPYADVAHSIARDAVADWDRALKAKQIKDPKKRGAWLRSWLVNNAEARAEYHRSVAVAQQSKSAAAIVREAKSSEDKAAAAELALRVIGDWRSMSIKQRDAQIERILKAWTSNETMFGIINRNAKDWRKHIEDADPPETIMIYWQFR